MEKPLFAPDYQEGTHPEIMRRLCETYVLKSDGYGTDAFCNEACEKIRAACDCSNAGDSFLSGGTQANAIVIDADLRPWQCVVDAESGHIKTREAGGHRVWRTQGSDPAPQQREYHR